MIPWKKFGIRVNMMEGGEHFCDDGIVAMTTLGLVVKESMNRETETDLVVVRRNGWRKGGG